MPAKPDFSRMPCSIARTLDVVGESWTLLILRDAFQGLRRFDEIQKSLGIATNVLTARLTKLVDEGILDQRRYQEHPPRYEYVLTEKGRDLGPILLSLVQFGNKWLAGSKEPPQAIVHGGCAHVCAPRLICSHCREPIAKGGSRIVPIAKMRGTRSSRATA
jgi:DNA-binding HxlR family transcriptional regulator